MGSHPINLAIRFLLELVALLAMGIWDWQQREGWLRLVLAVGIPLTAALLWGIFAVPMIRAVREKHLSQSLG
jgi:hypothetical protein